MSEDLDHMSFAELVEIGKKMKERFDVQERHKDTMQNTLKLIEKLGNLMENLDQKYWGQRDVQELGELLKRTCQIALEVVARDPVPHIPNWDIPF